MLRLIVNPAARNRKAAKTAIIIEEYLKDASIPFKTYYTERPGHATELAKSLAAEGSDPVVCIGGDGTAREVAAGLVGTDIPMGLIPAGTGNDFAMALGLPLKPLPALRRMLDGHERPIDCGTLNGQVFLNAASTGFDIYVLEKALAAKKYVKGILPYFYGVLCAIFGYAPKRMKVTADGTVVIDETLVVCTVANGKSYGGGIKIAPSSKYDDGAFELVIIRNVTKPRMVSYLPLLLMGKADSFAETVHLQAKEISIEAEELRANMDGEVMPVEKIDIRIVSGQLKLKF